MINSVGLKSQNFYMQNIRLCFTSTSLAHTI